MRGDRRGDPPDLTPQERPFHERASAAVPDAPPARVDVLLEDGGEIDLFSGARVVEVPGHTAGSIAVEVPSRRLLFTGDAAAQLDGRVIVGVFNVDRARARASFARMAQLDFDTACFGHGAPLLGSASLAFRSVAAAMRVPEKAP